MFDLHLLKKLPGETVWREVASPLGALTVLASDAGIRAIAFAGEQTERAKMALPRARAHAVLDEAVQQLTMYFDGDVETF